MDNPWKQFERKIGALLGLPKGKQRTGPTGMEGFDVIAPSSYTLLQRQLGVECKYQRDGWPKWLTDAIAQSKDHIDFHYEQSLLEEDAKPAWFDWVLALGYKGAKKEEILAVVPMEHYLRLRKELVATRKDLDDIEGLMATNDPVFDSNCVSLSRWRELSDAVSEIMKGMRRRLAEWSPDVMNMGKTDG